MGTGNPLDTERPARSRGCPRFEAVWRKIPKTATASPKYAETNRVYRAAELFTKREPARGLLCLECGREAWRCWSSTRRHTLFHQR